MASHRHRKHDVGAAVACVIILGGWCSCAEVREVSWASLRPGDCDVSGASTEHGRAIRRSSGFEKVSSEKVGPEKVSSDWLFLKSYTQKFQSNASWDTETAQSVLEEVLDDEWDEGRVGVMPYVLEDKLLVSRLISAIYCKFGHELRSEWRPIHQMPTLFSFQKQKDWHDVYLRLDLWAKRCKDDPGRPAWRFGKRNITCADTSRELSGMTQALGDELRAAIAEQLGGSHSAGGETASFQDFVVKATHLESWGGFNLITSDRATRIVQQNTTLLDFVVQRSIEVFVLRTVGPSLRSDVRPAVIVQPAYPTPEKKANNAAWNEVLANKPLEVRVKVIWGRAYLAADFPGRPWENMLLFRRSANDEPDDSRWVPYFYQKHEQDSNASREDSFPELRDQADRKEFSEHVMKFIPKIIHHSEFLARRLRVPLLRLDFFVPPPHVSESDWPVALNEVELWDGIHWTLPDSGKGVDMEREAQKEFVSRLQEGWASAVEVDGREVLREIGCQLPPPAAAQENEVEAYQELDCGTGPSEAADTVWYEEKRRKAIGRQVLHFRPDA